MGTQPSVALDGSPPAGSGAAQSGPSAPLNPINSPDYKLHGETSSAC